MLHSSMRKSLNMTISIFFILIGIGTVIFMFINPKLYCKIAMWGSINSVPAMCIKEAINELKN